MPANDRPRVDPNSKLRFALLQVGDSSAQHRVTITNLSRAGFIAVGTCNVTPGSRVRVLLRNNGWAEAKVTQVTGDQAAVEFIRGVNTADVSAAAGEAAQIVRQNAQPSS